MSFWFIFEKKQGFTAKDSFFVTVVSNFALAIFLKLEQSHSMAQLNENLGPPFP